MDSWLRSPALLNASTKYRCCQTNAEGIATNRSTLDRLLKTLLSLLSGIVPSVGEVNDQLLSTAD